MLLAFVLGAAPAWAADLASLASQPLGSGEAFRPVSEGRLVTAAVKLREALGPLDRLLARSSSGENWRKYLDWSALQQQAASGPHADVATLRRLFGRLDAGENGLEMPQFAAVRRAVGGYLEAADAASNPQAVEVYTQRLEKLAAAVAAGAASGTPEPLDPVGPLLARLEDSGQAPGAVARIRGAVSRPNLFLEVDESLLGTGVNRAVDEVAPINDTLLGTRVRGTGVTSGLVYLDFVPNADRATVDLALDATNHSDTKGSQGPVTVRTLGTTKVGARKRLLIDDRQIVALPVEANASTDTRTAGIGVSSKFGKRLIRRIASKKIAQMRPQAEAIAEGRARDRVREQFESQTMGPIAQAARDYQAKFRRPLMERGWYPEMLHLNTSSSRLHVTARKALADQIAAFTAPPPVDPDAVLSARVHESMVNNSAEITLGGRTITQKFVEEQMKKNDMAVPMELQNDADQPPWSITFAKRRPVELDVEDNRVKLTVRGSNYTSGDREFDAMDIWATYRIEPGHPGMRLVRDGDVQIYPPGFVPGGSEKLNVQQTSLRRILQKRFNKVFKEVVDLEPLKLPGELAKAGPLPIEQLDARKDGWVAAGWRKPYPVVSESAPREIVVSQEPTVATVVR
ncbi:MAG: hypothetical protein FJ286_09115 [Planctomycetes bacterium]|nr:hypothetical protein [Planctomycetota bacterium]